MKRRGTVPYKSGKHDYMQLSSHLTEERLSESWRFYLYLHLVFVSLIIPDAAFASSPYPATANTPMSDGLCVAATWITGTVGTAIAMLTVQITGIGAILGKVSWGLMMLVCANVALLFGGKAIIDLFSAGVTANGCEYLLTGTLR